MAFKLWAAQEQKEEILAVPKNPVAKATASPSAVAVGKTVTFDGSESYDKDIKATWDEVDGKKYNYQEVEIDGVVEKWEWKFGDASTGEGETTTHTYIKPNVSEKGHEVELTITADHKETAEATTSVRIWPKIGEMKITGPAVGKSGQPRTYTAHVWDTHDGEWGGSEYPVLDYRWWHCGMSDPQGVPGDRTKTFRFYPPFPDGDWYLIKFGVTYEGPEGQEIPREWSDIKHVRIFWWPGWPPGKSERLPMSP